MSQRIVVGLIALPIVIAVLLLGGIWSTLTVWLMCMGGAYEFYQLMDKADLHPARWLGLLWVTLLVFFYAHPLWTDFLPSFTPSLTIFLSVGVLAVFIRSLFQIDKPLLMWISTVVGAVYVGVLGGQFAAIRLLEGGLWWLTLGIVITWANDTAAYFIGTYLGRLKLWPRLSPKKTWEGTVGGWLGAGILSYLFYLLFAPPIPLSALSVILIGITGGILALFGDLSISMLKRQIGVKDSGQVFPGHGGMLDRMDSLLFVMPFIYQAAMLLA